MMKKPWMSKAQARFVAHSCDVCSAMKLDGNEQFLKISFERFFIVSTFVVSNGESISVIQMGFIGLRVFNYATLDEFKRAMKIYEHAATSEVKE